MQKQAESLCIRCGLERIFASKWVDKSAKGPAITHTRMVCPDKKCQKIVDEQLKERSDRLTAFRENSQKRKEESAKLRLEAKNAKLAKLEQARSSV